MKTSTIALVYGPPDHTQAQLRKIESELNQRFEALGIEFVVLPHGAAIGPVFNSRGTLDGSSL